MNGKLFPLDKPAVQRKKDIEYLLGFDIPGSGRLYGNLKHNRIPLLGSPFSEHLNEVNRFLFDGGISFDIQGADSDDPRQEWLNMQLEHMGLAAKLKDLWKTGAITGEVFAAFQLSRDPNGSLRSVYNVKFYDRSEYTPVYDDDDNLLEVQVFSLYSHKGADMVFKRTYTSEAYIEWPMMTLQEALKKNLPEPEIFPHAYGAVPGAIIRNQRDISSNDGIPEFDCGSVDMAIEIALQLCDAASNYHYFGEPKLLSPDPEETLNEIRQRSQVLLKDSEDANGNPEYLGMPPLPPGHPKYIEQLVYNLRKKLGSPIADSSGVSDGTSSLTLRMLNAATISTAEDRWQTYVNEGLCPLFKNMLIAAAFDGILGNVTPLDPSTHMIKVKRKKPYFPESPTERQTSVNLAESLIMLGIAPEIALSEEVYKTLTPEEVLERLSGDL